MRPRSPSIEVRKMILLVHFFPATNIWSHSIKIDTEIWKKVHVRAVTGPLECCLKYFKSHHSRHHSFVERLQEGTILCTLQSRRATTSTDRAERPTGLTQMWRTDEVHRGARESVQLPNSATFYWNCHFACDSLPLLDSGTPDASTAQRDCGDVIRLNGSRGILSVPRSLERVPVGYH